MTCQLRSYTALLLAVGFLILLNASGAQAARCTGAADCRACSNCSRCKHCGAGGTCGVCRGKSKTSPDSDTHKRVAESSIRHAKKVAEKQIDLQGRVVGVSDGDTITVLVERDGKKQQVKVRLHGVDCPESAQSFGTKAKQFTGSLVFDKSVTVLVTDTDRYGRKVGTVTLPDGRRLNHQLVAAGLAWWYHKYAPDDKELSALEQEARKAKRGLWSDTQAVEPWKWRQTKRTSKT